METRLIVLLGFCIALLFIGIQIGAVFFPRVPRKLEVGRLYWIYSESFGIIEVKLLSISIAEDGSKIYALVFDDLLLINKNCSCQIFDTKEEAEQKTPAVNNK